MGRLFGWRFAAALEQWATLKLEKGRQRKGVLKIPLKARGVASRYHEAHMEKFDCRPFLADGRRQPALEWVVGLWGHTTREKEKKKFLKAGVRVLYSEFSDRFCGNPLRKRSGVPARTGDTVL